jgi:hypothetical protein
VNAAQGAWGARRANEIRRARQNTIHDSMPNGIGMHMLLDVEVSGKGVDSRQKGVDSERSTRSERGVKAKDGERGEGA